MRPPSQIGVTALTPASVSTITGEVRSGTIPFSKANPTRQRIPLPHISPSDPSALNMVIRRSAWSDGSARMIPSPPTPLWRSLMATASAGQSRDWPDPSMKT